MVICKTTMYNHRMLDSNKTSRTSDKYTPCGNAAILVSILSILCNILLILMYCCTQGKLESHQNQLNAIRDYIHNSSTSHIGPYVTSDHVLNDSDDKSKIILGEDLYHRFKRSTPRKKNRKSKKKGKKNRSKKGQCKHEILHLIVDISRSSPRNPNLLTRGKEAVVDYWKLTDNSQSHRQSFAEYHANGTVTITKSGVYLIYSQLTYFDRAGRWSHQVEVNSRPFVKCLGSEWGVSNDPDTGQYYNTVHQCYTSAVRYVGKNSLVSIRSMYADRVIHQDESMSFWGILKMT